MITAVFADVAREGLAFTSYSCLCFIGLCVMQEEQMDELNKTAERNTELEARIGFMLSSRQVIFLT